MDTNPIAQSDPPSQSTIQQGLERKAKVQTLGVTTQPHPQHLFLKVVIPILFLIVAIGSFFVGSKYYEKNQATTIHTTSKIIPSPKAVRLPSALPISHITPTPTIPASSITGTLKKLSGNMQLMPDGGFPVTYYEAGTFNSGKYSGYKRIIAVHQIYLPGETSCGDDVFLTKDDVHYIGNGDANNSYNSSYNKNKVTQTATVDYSVPSTIRLDNNFSLSVYGYILSFKNRDGKHPPDCTLNYPSNKNMVLLSSSTSYNIYSVNRVNNPLIATDPSVIVVDKAGLPFEYQLSEKESHRYLAGTGPGQYATATDNIFDYNDGGLRDSKLKNPDNFYNYEPGFNTTYPDYPRFIPNFSSLKTSDFTQVDNTNGNIPIYILFDSTAASIYQTRYRKIPGIAQTYVGKPTTYFGKGFTFHQPTYAEYAQKHPFIFIKDYFGRFVLFEEDFYKTWQGPMVAGKPVIYLYPTQPEDVTVQLDFNGTITDSYPSFDNQVQGWKVKAYPNGKLIDSKNGKEYSYLFWEGLMNNKAIDTSEGFIVPGNETLSFLQNKLQELGLTPKEYNEFIVYWLPKMQHNKYNYVKFLQNEYTDNAKLAITPRPDSILRVFMAYRPLEEKIDIKPQTLPAFNRKGFTVIEWGAEEILGNIAQ